MKNGHGFFSIPKKVLILPFYQESFGIYRLASNSEWLKPKPINLIMAYSSIKTSFMTIEHLLFALLNNDSASTVLKACGANLNSLHGDLIKFIEENSTTIEDLDEEILSLQ